MLEKKEIPGTLGFTATQDGRIFDADGRERNYYRNGDGYTTTSVKWKDGEWRTTGVHRLVAMAWLDPKANVATLTVNHIDCNISNNDVDNLEWLPNGLNILHGALMRGTELSPSLILTDKTGRETFVSNLQTAATKLGVDLATAWDLVKHEITYEGAKLRPYVRGDVIPESLRKATIPYRGPAGRPLERPVSVRDLFSEWQLEFPSLAAAARHFAVSPSHIYQAISSESHPKLFKKRYQVTKSQGEFYDLDPMVYRTLAGSTGHCVLGWNKKTGQVLMFPSASSLIRELGLSKKSVTVRLKEKGYGETEEWVYAYEDYKHELSDRISEFQLAERNKNES